MHRGAPDQASKDVAAKLVRGRDAVRDEERRGPRVLGDDSNRDVSGLVVPVLLARKRLDLPDERLEHVGPIDIAGNALKDLGDALETCSRVDVLLRQRNERAVGLAVVLLEDEVPDLEPSAAAFGRTALVLRNAGLRALVDE